MAKFVIGCSLAVVASADCLSDLENVVTDVAGAAEAIKGLVSDCTGSDRSKCQTDVGSLIDSLDKMQKDIAPCTTSCGSHGKACTDAINQLGSDIGAIKEPAQDMADKCAGKDKSTMECAFDGIKVGAASVKVLADVHSTYNTCKSGRAARDQPNGMGCDLCKEIIGKGIDAGVTECHALCKKAGSLDGVCEQACDLIKTECDGSVNCPAKVCGLVHLCDKTVQADRNGATTLNLTWKSCGGSATIDSVTPAQIQTGTTTTITGEGSCSESVTGGSFSANVKAGPVKLASCEGKLGEEKKCPLPLGSGSITLDKIPLPISGKTSLNMDIQLSGSLPAMLLHTVTHLEATDQDGKQLVCLDVTLAPAKDANSTIVV